METEKIIHTVSATILALFAMLTLFLSSSVIFDWFGIRAKEGNYVLVYSLGQILFAAFYTW